MAIPRSTWRELDYQKLPPVQRGDLSNVAAVGWLWSRRHQRGGGFPQLHCANAQCWVGGQNSQQKCLFDVLWCSMCQLLDDCGGGTSKEGGRAPPTVWLNTYWVPHHIWRQKIRTVQCIVEHNLLKFWCSQKMVNHPPKRRALLPWICRRPRPIRSENICIKI